MLQFYIPEVNPFSLIFSFWKNYNVYFAISKVLAVEQVIAPEEEISKLEFKKFEKKLAAEENATSETDLLHSIKPKPKPPPE